MDKIIDFCFFVFLHHTRRGHLPGASYRECQHGRLSGQELRPCVELGHAVFTAGNGVQSEGLGSP